MVPAAWRHCELIADLAGKANEKNFIRLATPLGMFKKNRPRTPALGSKVANKRIKSRISERRRGRPARHSEQCGAQADRGRGAWGQRF